MSGTSRVGRAAAGRALGVLHEPAGPIDRRPLAASLVLLLLVLALQPAVAAEREPGESDDAETAARRLAATERPSPLGIGRVFDGAVADSVYIVGPGDRFTLEIGGVTPLVYTVDVNLEGQIVLPELGAIPVAGTTLALTKARVLERLRAASPRSSITLSLTSAREFRVFLTGAVTNPGSYRASPADRVSDLLAIGGPLHPSASSRNLRVIRRDGDTLRADLMRFHRLGDLAANPLLRDGDLVMVPFLLYRVEVYGGVHNPGSYEFVDGERFSDLVGLAGGWAPAGVPDSIALTRLPSVEEAGLTSYFSYPAVDPPLEPRAQFFVRIDPRWKSGPTVTVIGEFVHPMTLPIVEGQSRVKDAVRAAGGFTRLAAVGEVTLVRAGAYEQVQDLEFERLKRVPVADMSKDEYEYFKMKSRERIGRMQVDFVRLLSSENSPDNILLRDGDIINAPRVREFVQVSGQVADPGNVQYDPALTVSDYVSRAGGFAWKAKKSGTTLIRARTGEWVRDPDRAMKLEPGDALWVPEKPDRDFWVLFRDGMLVTAQAATVILLARQITK